MSPRVFSTSVSMMFRELPLLERFAAARTAGFQGVEIQFLAEGDPREMARAARDAGVDVVLVNVGMGDYLAGGAGLSGVPGREAVFLEEVGLALEAAGLMQARFVHLGPSRVPEGMTRDDCLAVYRGNVDAALARHAATDRRARLLVEPMNRVETPTALINDIDQGAAFLREHYAGRIGLQFDIYHVAMNGADVVDRFRACRDLVEHVQFADMPGRGPPGTGTLDFATMFAGLEAAGYAGGYGAEYLPGGPTIPTFGWMDSLRNRA